MKATGEYALLTGSGAAAIACIEASGQKVASFVQRHVRAKRRDIATWQTGDVHRATIIDGESAIDDIIITVHATDPMPRIRLHLHGGPWIARRCCELLGAAGLRERCDEPDSDLSLDAFIDAELHRTLPRVLTLDGAKWLVRQAHQLRGAVAAATAMSDVAERSRRLRELSAGAGRTKRYTDPFRIALVGAPNAGKSTLFNAFAGEAASIVSDIPGTTRDWVEAPGEIGGFPVTWIDTAGLRHATDAIEAEGIERTRRTMASSDAVVLLVDPGGDSRAQEAHPLPRAPDFVVHTKADRWRNGGSNPAVTDKAAALSVSALSGWGLDAIRQSLLQRIASGVDLALPGAFTESTANRLAMEAEC